MAKWGGGRVGLGLWILAPILGLIILFEVLVGLPSVDCDGTGSGASAHEELLVCLLTAGLSLGAFAAAGRRIVALRRDGRAWNAPTRVFAFAAGAGVLLGAVEAILQGSIAFAFYGVFLTGLVLTGAALAILLGGLLSGRDVDAMGGVLAFYLVGAGLFCYPLLLFLSLLGQSGIAC